MPPLEASFTITRLEKKIFDALSTHYLYKTGVEMILGQQFLSLALILREETQQMKLTMILNTLLKLPFFRLVILIKLILIKKWRNFTEVEV